MTMLYGVLPPAMAWALHSEQPQDADRKTLSSVKPFVFGAGLLACCIMVEQIFQDFSAFHS